MNIRRLWQRSKWWDGQPYGWVRVLAGAALLDISDPAWWQEDAQPLIDLATLNIADPQRCVLAQRYGHDALPMPGDPWGRPDRYTWGCVLLGITQDQAQRCGFNGPDADQLTPAWRSLITGRRNGTAHPPEKT